MCSIDCQCLPGPTGTFCGWIGKADGLVHPCDPGCCQPACDGPPPSTLGEYKRTYGTEIPPGFGTNLMTSERATKFKLEAPFHISKPNYGPAYHIRFYWLLFLIAVMALMIMFLV